MLSMPNIIMQPLSGALVEKGLVMVTIVLDRNFWKFKPNKYDHIWGKKDKVRMDRHSVVDIA